MTTLIEVPARQHDISLHVGVAPAEVLAVLDNLGFDCDPFAGVELLGHDRNQRTFGMTWHPGPGVAGRLGVIWDIRVEPDGAGGSCLSSTRRFTAPDDGARADLRNQHELISASTDTLARRNLRVIKRAAEQQSRTASVTTHAELPLAA